MEIYLRPRQFFAAFSFVITFVVSFYAFAVSQTIIIGANMLVYIFLTSFAYALISFVFSFFVIPFVFIPELPQDFEVDLSEKDEMEVVKRAALYGIITVLIISGAYFAILQTLVPKIGLFSELFGLLFLGFALIHTNLRIFFFIKITDKLAKDRRK